MSWSQTKPMPPSPQRIRLKRMNRIEFIALNRGLLRHPAKTISRRHRQAAPGADASAIHGRLGARVALLQSPILPAARSSYSKEKVFRSIPVDNTHTRLRCVSGECPASLPCGHGGSLQRQMPRICTAHGIAALPTLGRLFYIRNSSSCIHGAVRCWSEGGLGMV